MSSHFSAHQVLRAYVESKARIPADVRSAILHVIDDGWQDYPPDEKQLLRPGRWRVRFPDGSGDTTCLVSTVASVWVPGSKCRPMEAEVGGKNPNARMLLAALKRLPTLGQCVLVSDVVRAVNETIPKE